MHLYVFQLSRCHVIFLFFITLRALSCGDIVSQLMVQLPAHVNLLGASTGLYMLMAGLRETPRGTPRVSHSVLSSLYGYCDPDRICI